MQRRLNNHGLLWSNCVADTGYSSGENYAFLEEKGLRSFIPPHGTYKGIPDGFKYNKERDYYICPQGKIIPFKKVFVEKKNNTKKKEYRASKRVCVDSPIRTQCLGKSTQEKKFTVTFYREEYERNIARGKQSNRKVYEKKTTKYCRTRIWNTHSVFRTPKNNTLGLKQANKVMHLSAMVYNLKKYLKFTQKRVKSGAKALNFYCILKNLILQSILRVYSPLNFYRFIINQLKRVHKRA